MILKKHTLETAALVVILSIIVNCINFCTTRYTGVNYFPQETLSVLISLILMYSGFCLLSGKDCYLAISMKECVYLFLLFSLIAFASNAIQYTPYKPIDDKLIAIESYFHLSMPKIVSWTHMHSSLKSLLELSYSTLPYQMSLFPLMAIFTKRYDLLRDYYFLMLTTLLVGFTIYYFFPTTAPASNGYSPFYSSEQLATGMKFKQIHHHIHPKTLAGGVIAFPSFHVIWACLGMYLLRPWRIVFFIVLTLNTLLISACVLLGWHYLIDVLTSFVLIFFCNSMLKQIDHKQSQSKAGS